MKLALFGATGRTGGLIMERALLAGHQVTALVRDKQKSAHSGLRMIQGDARQPHSVADTVQGADVVISALGAGGDTLSLFGRNAMAAMERFEVRRIVSLVGASIVMPDDPPSMSMNMLRLITRTLGGKMLKDGEVHARELALSNLDYTPVRPPRLTNRPAREALHRQLCEPELK